MVMESRRVRPVALVLCAGLLLTGCTTFEYRKVQEQFNKAVQADSVSATDIPLGAPTTGDAKSGYQEVISDLTKEPIDKLDDRLKPNAYAILAVAQWRTGALNAARDTAITGLKLPNVDSSPRDRMVLAMIPGVVIDQELVTKFDAANRDVSEADYNATYPRDFATAATTLKQAYTDVLPATPQSIVFYVHMQRWRTLQNWRVIISRIDGGRLSGADARERARVDAKQRLGQDLVVEIAAEEASVPANDPIRKAMAAVALHP